MGLANNRLRYVYLVKVKHKLMVFKNAGITPPEITNCRLCKEDFQNSFYSGSDFVTVVCPNCKQNMVSDKIRRMASKITGQAEAENSTVSNATEKIIAEIYEDVNAMYLVDFDREAMV